LPREKVFVHTTKFLGGGFGRRSTLDYNLEAVEVSKKLKRPVKLMWSREDDMQHSPMRPISYHHFKGSVEKGKILGWQHKYAGQSIMGLRIPQWMPHIMGEWVPDFASQWAGKGAKKFMGAPTLQEGSDIPYSIEHKNIRMFVQEDIAVPIHFWRSVGHSIQGFVTEGFLDELCSEAELDPYAARIDLLKKHPRALGVLKRVAEISNWGKKAGVHQGIAYHKSFNTHVAEVAEVRVENKQIFVDKVYCAVDCGFAVNPTVVQTQLRSAVIYGLSAVLNGEITIENGGVVQSNFHDYEPLRISQSPEIKVSIIESDEDPTGVGEPGLPPIAAAVANAVFKASGVRLRSLPLRLS
ncbi:MAG: xanthine dehydrogenase family protein molybdopterin-binding subunit, partial [Bdellovibrionales bacterium]|nr:xanthine dehydrogenase family protein molybdopterin-binding subunit [Bdellovibrionales bacterium]